MLPRRRPDSFLAFSRAQRVYLAACLVLGTCFVLSPWWYPRRRAALLEDAQLSAELLAEANRYDSLIRRQEDSVRTAREERSRRYAAWRERRDASEKRPARGRSRWPSDRGSRGDGDRRPAWRRALDSAVAATPLPAASTLDPNDVDEVTLRRLAVPEVVVRRWLRFRERGGTFVRREDIARLYDLPDSTYRRIAPYFLEGPALRERFDTSTEPVQGGGGEAPAVVEVNAATVEDLVAVRGIGDFYARQIVEYRDRLGGFLAVEQVAEVRGLRADAYARFAEQLTVDPAGVRRLRLNLATVDELAAHPYLSRKQARILADYRVNRGAFAQAEDLYGVVAVDSATVQRLAPYLDFAR